MRVLVGLLAVAPLLLHAQPRPGSGLENGHPAGYVCPYTTIPVTIDGRLDDESWRRAPWTTRFGDIEGSLKPDPRYATRVKMLWDDRYFYVAAELEEPHVWANLRQRDTVIFYDNDFEVFIDPDGDNHEYYEFEMNALNTGWDLFLPKPYRDGGRPVDAWDVAGLRTAVHVDGTLNDPRDSDRGWSLEIAFPWSALAEYARCPTPPREGDQWRVNFSRVEWETEVVNGAYRKLTGRREDNWVWSPQWVIDMHRPETWGYVQFTRGSAESGEFRPDTSLHVRAVLMRIYYAQQEYRERNSRWARTMGELGLEEMPLPGSVGIPVLRIAEEWSASAEFRGRQWSVSEDSRITHGARPEP